MGVMVTSECAERPNRAMDMMVTKHSRVTLRDGDTNGYHWADRTQGALTIVYWIVVRMSL